MKKLYLFLILIFAVAASAQEKILEGSFKNLSGISSYNVVFDYSGMKVYDYESEEAFFKEKIDRRGEEKAAEFKNKWFGDREALYEPKFIAYFNERMKGKATVAKDAAAPYTIFIKSTWLYPGYSFGVGKEEAKISALITVYETANPANVLLKVEYDRSIGLEPTEKSGDTGYRIAGAYEKLARNLTLQLKRFIK